MALKRGPSHRCRCTSMTAMHSDARRLLRHTSHLMADVRGAPAGPARQVVHGTAIDIVEIQLEVDPKLRKNKPLQIRYVHVRSPTIKVLTCLKIISLWRTSTFCCLLLFVCLWSLARHPKLEVLYRKWQAMLKHLLYLACICTCMFVHVCNFDM